MAHVYIPVLRHEACHDGGQHDGVVRNPIEIHTFTPLPPSTNNIKEMKTINLKAS